MRRQCRDERNCTSSHKRHNQRPWRLQQHQIPVDESVSMAQFRYRSLSMIRLVELTAQGGNELASWSIVGGS